MDPYQVLGVPREASPDLIRAAYRRAAARTHPDREGGSEAAFNEVSEAFQILTHPARKKLFDETGATAVVRERDIQAEAREQVVVCLSSVLEQVDPEAGKNILSLARGSVVHKQAEVKAKLEEMNEKSVRISNLLRRTKNLDKIVVAGLERAKAQIETQKADIHGYLKMTEEMLRIFDESSFEEAQVMSVAIFGSHTSTSSASSW